MVKGWCAAWGWPSAPTPSNMGKSTTQTYRCGPSLTGGAPIATRSVPSTAQAVA